MMMIGTVALTGLGIPGTVIGTAGFFSKDAIIESAFVGQNAYAMYAFVLLVIAALFTSFYSWRLIFMTFHGKPRASVDVMNHVHESPNVMLIPLYILAAGALLAGFVFHDAFVGHATGGDNEFWYNEFWRTALYSSPSNTVLETFHDVPKLVKWSPFIRPAKWIGHFLWKKGDGWLIDGFGPNGISARVLDVTGKVVKLQSGYLYHYAFAMMIGIAALITWSMFGGAG